MAGRIKVFFDGGCRPNPGRMEIAVVAAGRTSILQDAGHGTNMDAEWLALIHALTIAQALEARDFVLLGDAIAVVNAVNGATKCNGSAVHHLAVFRALTAGGTPRVRYIKRSQNLAGIALAALHRR